jgi:uncharacterized protein YegJ (DUF2314 family)
MRHALVILAIVPSLAFAQRAPDKPVKAAGQVAYDALLKAEAPYIAKARASYPAAEKRFLAGLPTGYRFEVRKRLADPNDSTYEEVFIEVDAIKDGKVFGRIGSELGAVHSYRQWQNISFPKSDVLDWTIVDPDGREEGNYVGKFIDTYKPERVANDAASITARDGSSRERAIVNDQPSATHMQWEYRYLDQHFPGRKPINHRIDADAPTQRVWSVFVFTWQGKKQTFWFDITGPFNEFRRTHHQ